MTIAEILLADFDSEATNTRRVLERIPDDKADWKPHAKSTPLKSLANHVGHLPVFGLAILTTPLLDRAAARLPIPEFETVARLLETSADATSQLRSALAAMSDDDLLAEWTLCYGDRVVVTAPRHLLYRSLFLNHTIHHRGQLSVYLRLLDIPVPGIYGPSADEPLKA